MSDSIPTPEQAEQALFFIKWWKEALLGLSAILGAVVALIRKGRSINAIDKPKASCPEVITSREVEHLISISKHETKDEIHDKIREIMAEHKEDMIKRIRLMLDARLGPPQ